MKKKVYHLLVFVLSFGWSPLFGQIFGSTQICPGNVTYSYSVNLLSNCNNNGTGGALNSHWSIGGGVFVDPIDGSESSFANDVSSVIVRWTSTNPTFAGSINVDYVFGPGPFPCGETLLANYIYPPGTTATDPASVVPSTGSFCLGSVTTIGLTAGVGPGSGQELVFEYTRNGGGFQPITITSGNSTSFDISGAVGGDVYEFFVYSRFALCQNITSPRRTSGTITAKPAAPTGSIAAFPLVCTSNGSIVVSGLSASAIVRAISPSGAATGSGGTYSGTATLSATAADTYTVQLEDPGQGCFNNYPGIVVGATNPSVTVAVSGFTNVTCHGLNNGSIDITPSGGGGGGYAYLWSNSATSQDVSSLAGGLFSVTVTDGKGCTGTASQSIVDPPDLVLGTLQTSSYSGPGVSCVGASDGQIFFSTGITGGTGAYTYVWKNASNATVGTSSTLSSIPAGLYTVTVSDANLCQKTSGSVPVTSPTPITAGTAAGTNPICFGGNGSISISGTSGGTGLLTWSVDGASQVPTSFQALNLSFNASADTYVATVKDVNGCTATVTPNVVITNPVAIGVSNAIVNPSCFAGSDGKITVTASNGTGPYSFSNDGGANFQAIGNNVFNSGITAGSYSMVVKDSQGCLSPVSTAIVGQPTQVSGTITPPAPFSCFSTSNSATLDLTPSGGTGPYTFLWSTSAVTEDINVTLGSSLSTNYSVTITDSKSCANSRNITVTQPALLSNTISPTNISCFGANDGAVNLTPTGGTLPYTFLWNTGAVTEDISARPPGNYSVTITDNNGCTSPASALITEPTQLTVAQGATTNILCFGQSNGTVVLNASGGSPSYEYSKDGTTWQSSSLLTGLVLNSNLLHVRDVNLCPAQITVNITQPPLLSVSVSNIVDATCGLSNGSALASGTGGTGSYAFEWRDVSNNVVSSAAPLTAVPGGVFRVTLTDQNGCTDFHDTPIASPNGPQIAINSLTPTQCSYSNDGRAIINVTAGQSPYTVTWNNGETGNNPVALKPGLNVNFVTVTDATGCVAAKVVDVPSPPALLINVTSTQLPTCPAGNDGSIQTTTTGGTGALTYLWNTGAASPTLSNINPGNYQLTVKDAQNCVATQTVALADKPAISIQSTTLSPPTCNGAADGIIVANATGANGSFTYAWNTGAVGSTINTLAAGSYTVTAKDALGCTSQKTFTLIDPALLKIDLGPDRKICQGGSFRISSPVASPTYQWTSSNGFTSSASTVTLTQAGTYTLQVVNASGCKATDSFDLTTVTDLLKADFLIAPEAFESDTVVLIDISLPIPESISWRLPQSVITVAQTSDFAELVFPVAGTYTVTLDAALANCQSTHSENIVIHSGSRPRTGGRVEGEPLIKSAKLYPNPNIGEFFVDVVLSEVSPVEMSIVSLAGNRTVALFEAASTADHYVWPLHLMPLQQGIYIVVIKAGRETRSIQFVKI